MAAIFAASPIVLNKMRKLFFPYIATVFVLSLLFLACNTSPQPAAASPAPAFTDGTGLTPNVNVPLAYADTTLPQYREMIYKLDIFFAQLARTGFNGSVLIGQHGKVVYERYFGFANRETGLKLMPQTAGQLASTSKTFTGSAILYLHEHKFLNINDPVKEYIPSFPYPNITVKMLLNHRSGIPDYTKWVPRFRKDQNTPMSNSALLEMFAAYKPALEFRPDTRFKYSNSNYAILASIIEAVTETNYRDFMRRYVFEPLGMKNTFVFDPAKGLPANATISYKYNWVREKVMFADGIYGDKGIYSTVEDLYRWDQSFYSNKLLSKEMQAMAYSPYSFEKPGRKNYGLGWRMLNNPNSKVIYHNGWWHGNNNVFYRFIDENMTIVMLGNKYNSGIYHQAPIIYSIVKNVPVSKDFDSEE